MAELIKTNNTELMRFCHFCHFCGVGRKYKITTGNKKRLSVIISNQDPIKKSMAVTP
jgi:uncharacterized Zn finger protein